MKLYKAIEESIQYIGIDGVLGSAPSDLRAHLAQSISPCDDSTFQYIWRTLVTQPNLEVILTARPIAIDFQPDLKGKGKATDDTETLSLKAPIVVLHKMDGIEYNGIGSVEVSDYQALQDKWGPRLRVRCTTEEIHYQLTGKHQGTLSLSKDALSLLQLVAMARGKGIRYMSLTDLLGGGDWYSRMNMLVDNGLVAKVELLDRNANSNMIVHFRYLHLNPQYLSFCRLNPQLQNTLPTDVAASLRRDLQREEEEEIAGGEEDEEHGDENVGEWDLGMAPISDMEIKSPHMVQDRIMRILDHPKLTNHLIRYRGLIYAMGWRSKTIQKQHRAIRKVITNMVDAGIVENLLVGDDKKQVLCLRLTKYGQNLDEQEVVGREMQELEEQKPIEDIARLPLYRPIPGIMVTRTLERQLLELIANSPQGIIRGELKRKLNSVYLRIVEKVLGMIRGDQENHFPEQFWTLIVYNAVISTGRQSYINYLTSPHALAFFAAHAREHEIKPKPPTSGLFLDLLPHFYRSAQQFINYVERGLVDSDLEARVPEVPGKSKAGPGELKVPKKRGRPRKHGNEDVDTSCQTKTNKSVQPQKRGRPSKYVIVCNDFNGLRERKVCNEIIRRPDLPEFLLYSWTTGLVYPAPDSFNPSTKQPPPPYEQWQLDQGRPPAFYDKYPHGQKRSIVLRKPKWLLAMEAAGGIGGDSSHGGGGDGGQGGEEDEGDDADGPRASKRQRTMVNYGEAGEEVVAGPSGTTSDDQIGDLLPPPKKRGRPPKNKPAATGAKRGRPRKNPLPVLENAADSTVTLPDTSDQSQPIASHPEGETGPPPSNSPTIAGEPFNAPGLDQPRKRGRPRKSTGQGNGGNSSAIDTDHPSKSPSQPELITGPQTPAQQDRPQRLTSAASRKAVLAENRDDAGMASAVAEKAPADAGETTRADSTRLQTEMEDANAVEPAAMPSVLTLAAAEPGRKRKAITPQSQEDGNGNSSVSMTPLQTVRPLPASPRTSLVNIVDKEMSSEVTTPQDALGKRAKKKRKVKDADAETTSRGVPSIGDAIRASQLYNAIVDFGGAVKKRDAPQVLHDYLVKTQGADKAFITTSTYAQRMFNILIGDNRIRETKTKFPDHFMRHIDQTFYYLSDLPGDKLNAYIRAQAAKRQAPSRPGTREPGLLNAKYSDFARPSHPTKKYDGQSIEGSGIDSTDERQYYLRESANVVPQLYGYKLQRYIRTAILHRVIVEIASSPDSQCMISRSPPIFETAKLIGDIRIGDWFAMLRYTAYQEHVVAWLEDPAHREIRVRDVPPEIDTFSKPFMNPMGSQRFTILFEILDALKCVTPLVAAAGGVKVISANDADFQRSTMDLSPYYLLHSHVPVYHLVIEPEAPLLGVIPVRTVSEVERYWGYLREAVLVASPISIEEKVDQSSIQDAIAAFPESHQITRKLLQSMKNGKRWEDKPWVSLRQETALKSAIDPHTATLRGKSIKQLAWDVALPPGIVEIKMRQLMQAQVEVISHRDEQLRRIAVRNTERQEQIRQSIQARLAEEEVAARQVWEDRVKANALSQGIDYSIELLDFLSERTKGVEKKDSVPDAQVIYWVKVWDMCRGMSDEERQSLMASRKISSKLQGKDAAPKVVRQKKGSGGKRKKADNTSTSAVGQNNFASSGAKRIRRKWTSEDDDLIIDGEAIIRARSRTNNYRGRAILSELFPDVSAQTLRNRLIHIVSEPGMATYLSRLEQAWYEIWMKHRGTEVLPDDNIHSSVSFDIKSHLAYFRQTVDKRNLKLLATSVSVRQTERAPNLPADITLLLQHHDYSYIKAKNHSFETLADSQMAEDLHVSHLARTSFVMPRAQEENIMDLASIENDRDTGKLTATLKSIVATPSISYDPHVGQRLLQSWQEPVYEKMIADLVEKTVIRKIGSGSVAGTGGRRYDFTHQWQQLSDGPLPGDFFTEAAQLEKKLEAAGEEGLEWPLMGKAGELGALFGMVSNGEVEFSFKIKDCLPIRIPHYNTRKLNDDAYEFDFKVKRLKPAPPFARIPSPSPDACKAPAQWSIAPDADDTIVTSVMDTITSTGQEGISKPNLLSVLGLVPRQLAHALAKLSLDPTPRFFWAGYDTARAVDRQYWSAWCIVTRPLEMKDQVDADRLTQPKRWVDVYGKVMDKEWRRGCNAVIAHLANRPGISQKMLAKKLGPIFDRLELVDILDFLFQKGALTRRWINVPNTVDALPPVEATSVEEEELVGWWPVTNALLGTI
ncbi:hypothetical protein IAR50_000723 [Cryptococcus sp. DSM 104548]